MLRKGIKEVYNRKSVSVKGIGALLITVTLWGSSFPAIKVVVTNISPLSYTWIRALIASLGLLPYVLFKKLKNNNDISRSLKGGIITGFVFGLGLWLQGFGTKFTTASNSAFITGLNVVFVHVYMAFIRKDYNKSLGISLLFSILGLYFMTSPKGGFNKGDALVLLSAIMWAAQVILVDKYSESDPLVFTFGEMIPSILFLMPDVILHKFVHLNIHTILILIYLGIFCADLAFIFQILGQRYINPASAAIIYLLEPVIATLLSVLLLYEMLNILQIIGMLLIIVSLVFAQNISNLN